MSDVTNSARVNVYINGQSGIAEIDKLERKMMKLGKEVNRVGRDTELGRKLQAEMRLAQAEVDKLSKKMDITKLSIRQLESESRRLRRLRDMAQPGTQEFVRLNRELQNVNGRMREVQTGLGSFGQAWKQVWDQMKGFNALLAAVAVAMAIAKSIAAAFKSAAELSDQFVDIQKTTGMTKDEVRALNDEFKKIDTRTSTKELRDMAIVAGQLGIAKKDVKGFVESVDMMNVALGDEFTGGAKQVAEEMGKLRNVFTDLKSEKVDQDILKIGNALNVLSAEGAATAPIVAENANRIGGIGINIGLTTGQVLGLAAAQQELGIATERGSTAIGKILQKMLAEVETFAGVAGVPVKEFKTMLDTDLFGAFIKVVEGSKKVGNSNTKLAAIIDELEVSGAGASEVFAKFGSNVDLVKSKADLATRSLGNTQSIMEEFRLKNENAAAVYEKIGKAITGWFSRKFVEPAEKFLIWVGKATGLVQNFSQKLEQERLDLLITASRLNNVNMKQETRVALIKQLQEKYPSYLGNLNAETVSNNELQAAIDKVNKGLIDRITIQKMQEEVEKKAEEAAEQQIRNFKLEKQIREQLIKIADENKGIYIPQGDVIKQAEFVLKQLALLGKDSKVNVFSDFNSLKNDLNYYKASLKAQTFLTEEQNKAIESKNQLLKTLKDTMLDVSEIETKTNVVTSSDTGSTSNNNEDEKNKKDPFKFNLDNWGDYKNKIAQFYKDLELLYATDTEVAIYEATRKTDALLQENWKMQQEVLAALWTGSKAERKQAQKQLNELLRDEEALNAQRAEEAGKAEARVNKERFKARQAAKSQIKSALMSEHERELFQVMTHYDELIALAKQYGIDYTKLVKARAEAIKAIQDKVDEAEIKKKKEKYEKIANLIAEYSNYAMSIINPIVDAVKNSAEQQILESEKVAERRMENLERARDQGLITEKQYQERKLAMEKKQAKEIGALRRKQIIADRIAATASVVFSTAKAVMEAVAQNPQSGGLPWSAIAAAAGAAQTYAIWNEPIPEYKKGLGGIPGGPSHERGGLDIVNSQTGRKVAEMEGGEPYMILSKTTYANNGPLIDKLLRASLYEGGRRLSAEELISSSPQLRMPSTTAVRSGFFRDGGVGKSPRRSKSTTNEMRLFVEAVNAFREALATPIRAELVYRDFKETEEEEARIRSLANIGSTKARAVSSRNSSTSQTVVVNSGGTPEPGPAGPPGADGTGLELYLFNNG